MIVPKAYYITNTNARWRKTSPLKTILNYRTEKKNIFVTQCVIIRNNDYLCSEKIKINNLSIIYH